MTTTEVSPEVSLRHTLATLAYRANRTIENAPQSFADTTAGAGARPAVEVLAHMGDLLDWALSLANGDEKWNDSTPLPWTQEVHRFHDALGKLDARIASGGPLQAPAAQIFQGAIADAIWHTGQLAMLRRLAASPIESENYAAAPIREGTFA
jgi:hypothetical protein